MTYYFSRRFYLTPLPPNPPRAVVGEVLEELGGGARRGESE